MRRLRLMNTKCVCLAACLVTPTSPAVWAYSSFSESIKYIDRNLKSGVIVSYDDLFDNPKFLILWQNADKYIEPTLEYLARAGNNKQGIFIAVTAMQNLSAISMSQYNEYARRLIELRRSNVIDDQILSEAILSNARITDLDPGASDILLAIKVAGFLEKRVESILAGRAMSGYLFWRNKGQYWPLRSGQ